MNIGFVDAIILMFILLGGLIGFKEGAIKKITSLIGIVLVFVIAFILKNKLSVYFYENLPFIDLWGIFKGIQVLNIIFYEIVAFIIIASILMLVYRIILSISGLIETVLKMTIILSIPSKILGFFIGLIESYIWVYVILFILTLPIINVKDVYDSKIASYIMKDTPYLSKYTNKTIEIYDNIYNIVDNRKDMTNKEINEETLDLMLKYDIITLESTKNLINKNKIDVSDNYLEKYE